MPMYVLLIYDISHDPTRLKVVRACEDFGLDRVQFSAFSGVLTRARQRELMLRLRRLMRQQTGIITLYPINQESWNSQIEVRHDPTP